MGNLTASTMFLASAVASTAGTLYNIQAQKAALKRENARLETESQVAQIQAKEEENARRRQLNQTIASNIAFQSASSYYDDSRSFLNINKQVRHAAEKDVASIRLQGQLVQTKFRDTVFENDLKKDAITFGGYTSAMSELTLGYAQYKYYKGA